MSKNISFLDIKTNKKMSDEAVAAGSVVVVIGAETKITKKGTKYSIVYHGTNGDKSVEVSKPQFETLSKLVQSGKKILIVHGGAIAGYEGIEKLVAQVSDVKPGRGSNQYPSNR